HRLMAVLIVYVALSALIAGTLGDIVWLAKLLDAFGVTPFLMFLVAPIAFRERRQRDILLSFLVGLGAYLSLTTLFERIGLDALIFPRYILDPGVGIHVERGRGPFAEAVTNGFALYMCVVASAIAYRQWRGSARAYLAASVGLLCLVGVVLSLQRSVWAAALVATLITLLTLGGYRRGALKLALPIIAAVGIAVLVIPGLHKDAAARFQDEATVHDRQNLSHA